MKNYQSSNLLDKQNKNNCFRFQLQQTSRLRSDREPEENGEVRHRPEGLRRALRRDPADQEGLLRHVRIQPQELR